ncbi:MAG: DUF1993 domain-containing protein [Moraxellaceae bacterium]|nr:DUF1993 domain-containing protein [Pseudobdellovibrionaceae bacterium]
MLFESTVPQFIKMLTNLNVLIEKSEAFAQIKKFEIDVLLNSRLAPDQFHLIRQVQIVCDTAKLGVSRLTGKEAPAHADTEKSLAEVKERINSTVTYLKKITANDFAGAETKHIKTPRWEDQYLTGFDYVQHHVIPNFYFHMTTVYSILRHNGVDIGKKDYLGSLPFKK